MEITNHTMYRTEDLESFIQAVWRHMRENPYSYARVIYDGREVEMSWSGGDLPEEFPFDKPVVFRLLEKSASSWYEGPVYHPWRRKEYAFLLWAATEGDPNEVFAHAGYMLPGTRESLRRRVIEVFRSSRASCGFDPPEGYWDGFDGPQIRTDRKIPPKPKLGKADSINRMRGLADFDKTQLSWAKGKLKSAKEIYTKERVRAEAWSAKLRAKGHETFPILTWPEWLRAMADEAEQKPSGRIRPLRREVSDDEES